MGEYREIKRRLLEDAVKSGATILKGDPCGVTAERAQRWLDKMYSLNPILSVPTQLRLLNRFPVGADPEFMFLGESSGEVQGVPATDLGFKTGLAYGADVNGRLAELRPKPSRFGLRVVASLLATLRWLAYLNPKTTYLIWKAGAYSQRDGLGGHIHFGRKRASRGKEIKALDKLTASLYRSNVFSKTEGEHRKRHTEYGKFGDYRLQTHGYEYRVLPSWLDSPWMAYFTIVVAKLAVYDPELVTAWRDAGEGGSRLKALLAYFKSRDDDAHIAYHALARWGLPRFFGGDFKGRWGVDFTYNQGKQDVSVLPPYIVPTDKEVQEMFTHLTEATPLLPNRPKLSWTPSRIPPGFESIIAVTKTAGQIGLGELIWDLCTWKNIPVTVQGSTEHTFYISSTLAKLLPHNWKERVSGDVGVFGSAHLHIRIPREMREWRLIATTKKLLTDLFPIWRMQDASREKAVDWFNKEAKIQKRVPEGTILVMKE